MKMEEKAKKFLEVFDGYKLAYGQHSNFKTEDNGKKKGRGRTVTGELPLEKIIKHLDGSGASLGIVPIKQKNKCKFGAIDLDIVSETRPLSHTMEEMEDLVRKLQLPLVVCQSKSKGIHLYCFTKTEVPAKLLVKKLSEWAQLIGYGSEEIFPKQTKREENRPGGWINTPYFNHEDTVRYCINKHKKLSLEEFFEFVEVMRISEKELKNFKMEVVDESYDDAPPCLQMLVNKGIGDGSRNEALFNFGVYFKQKYPDNFEGKMLEINGSLISPPVDLKEVERTIKSVNKEYFYKCTQYPICQYCNKDACRKSKYGIGPDRELSIDFDNLTKHVASSEDVFWEAEYQGRKVKLATDDLLNQKFLQKKLLEQLNVLRQPIKQEQWLKKIKFLLDTCETVEAPIDASNKGQFEMHFDDFLTGSTPSDERKCLITGMNYYDSETNLIYFKSPALFSFLSNRRFKFDKKYIWDWVKGMGGKSRQMRIGNKNIFVWFIKRPEVYNEQLDTDVKF